MQHDPAAHINTHMGNARCIIGTHKEHQISGTGIGRRYRGGNVVKSLGSQPSGIA